MKHWYITAGTALVCAIRLFIDTLFYSLQEHRIVLGGRDL